MRVEFAGDSLEFHVVEEFVEMETVGGEWVRGGKGCGGPACDDNRTFSPRAGPWLIMGDIGELPV